MCNIQPIFTGVGFDSVGVARAIAVAAGPRLREACGNYITTYGPFLKTGTVCLTTAGDMFCNKVTGNFI